MKNINIKNKFLIFVVFNIFYAVFYLYYKHEVGNDTSISEWLINYQGGFTRRGLGGEINILLANILSISLRDAIFLFQATIHTLYLGILFVYLKNLQLNIYQFFALFAPIFILYPIAELEALGRKEMIIFLFFVCILFFADERFNKKIINSIIFIFFPVLCLIWEEIILFAPYFAVILIQKNRLISFKDTFINLLIIFLPSIFVMIVVFALPLSNEGHLTMCNFLKNEFDERCYMSAELLIKNTIYLDTLFIHERANFFPHYFRYLMIFLIGFAPLHMSILKNNFNKKDNFVTKNFNPIQLYLFLYFPILLLFAFGHDWGRWIHITYSLSILLYFYLLKNSLITNNFNEYLCINWILKKKKILFFVFFIFAFFWNPKTLLTGDIATNSLYKIIYNSSKIIFNYKGIRIFQDNPIIKFHKEFIE
ncbi:hypothetical protein IDH20_01500 [Pelagibacterales bacterium SAG-MED39]|nr:hypothetical protein [Pelagibacterales bacterium SAG-MED39]